MGREASRPAMVCWPGTIPPNQVVSQPVCNVDMVPTLGAIAGLADTLIHLPINGIDISPVLFEQKTIARDIFWKYKDQRAFQRGDWKMHNTDELYNLASDISEKNNVADQHPDQLKELQQAYEQINNTLTQ